MGKIDAPVYAYMSKALIAMGSNLGRKDHAPAQILRAALEEILHADIVLTAQSRLWVTPPWPPELAATQKDYFNAVIAVETGLGRQALMERLHAIEARFGRDRAGEGRWAARSLDLDLLDYDGEISAPGEWPVLPHPRMAERLFVLAPLAEVAPDWQAPQGGNIQELIEKAMKNGQAASLAPQAVQALFLWQGR